jgi:acylphosphatase
MKARAHILVSGRVQGVFFRDHTHKWARSLLITGWVRNVDDGKVEVLAEGERENVESLIGHLEEGPPMAIVDNVEVDWQEYKGEFHDFRITLSEIF